MNVIQRHLDSYNLNCKISSQQLVSSAIFWNFIIVFAFSLLFSLGFQLFRLTSSIIRLKKKTFYIEIGIGFDVSCCWETLRIFFLKSFRKSHLWSSRSSTASSVSHRTSYTAISYLAVFQNQNVRTLTMEIIFYLTSRSIFSLLLFQTTRQ